MKMMQSTCVVWFCLANIGFAAPPSEDIVFATIDERELKLDLALPEDSNNPPLVVYIHGGGWSQGNRKPNRIEFLSELGFAVASISYRFSDKATFPAQVHDCKGAIRWLRANAEEYGFDATRVGVVGTSAGGHLALMLGVTGDDEQMEGTVGENLEHSSRVQAVVDYFGPSDFVLSRKSDPSGTEDPDGNIYRLLGGTVSQNQEKAWLASPTSYVTADDPPLLILHGDKDEVVLLEQSERMNDEYQKENLEATFVVVPDGGHGPQWYMKEENVRVLVDFLSRHLRGTSPPKIPRRHAQRARDQSRQSLGDY